MYDEYIRFQNDVMGSKKMQDEIMDIAKDTEKIISYANEKGYNFTMKEVESAISGEVELSEDDLDSVAGGSLNVVCGAAFDVTEQATVAFHTAVSGICVF